MPKLITDGARKAILRSIAGLYRPQLASVRSGVGF